MIMLLLNIQISSLETALFTLAGGVFLYLLSKLLENIVIIPLQTYVKIKSDIKYLLVYHANKFGQKEAWGNREQDFFKGLDEIRKISSEIYSISCIYWFARFIRIVPSKQKLEKVGELLMGLSNSVKELSPDSFKHIEDKQKEIRNILKI